MHQYDRPRQQIRELARGARIETYPSPENLHADFMGLRRSNFDILNRKGCTGLPRDCRLPRNELPNTRRSDLTNNWLSRSVGHGLTDGDLTENLLIKSEEIKADKIPTGMRGRKFYVL